MSTGPDWTIRIPDSGTPRLTGKQQDLLQALEAGLPTSGAQSDDVSALATQVAPIVRALVESGLTAEQIADNSRLRPAFVAAIVAAGA